MTATDKFPNHETNPLGSAEHLFAVTPSDTVDLPFVTRAIHVGVTGDLVIQTVFDEIVTLKNVVAGVPLPYRAKRIWNTNTTATYIIGAY